jgi:hypothetical protein
MLAYFYMDNRLSVSQFDLIIFEDIIALYLKTLQVCLFPYLDSHIYPMVWTESVV